MLALLVWLVLLVAAAKTHSVKQVLVAGTKQSKQANKADRLTRQAGRQGKSGLLNLYLACLLCFVPASRTLVFLKSMFHKLICVEQSTFLDVYASAVFFISLAQHFLMLLNASIETKEDWILK
jgi:hypothetical protein